MEEKDEVVDLNAYSLQGWGKKDQVGSCQFISERTPGFEKMS